MVAHKLRQALGLSVIGAVILAAISVVSAQSVLSTALPAQVSAESAIGLSAAEPAAAQVTVESAGLFGAGEGAAVFASDDGVKSDVTLTGEEVAVAQTPPPIPGVSTESAEAAKQLPLLSERDWSDGYKTVVECTGDVARTCQANVYGPNGEFILGRTINANGEAADCNGPCLDSTGAQLDPSYVSRAQAGQTHKIITSAGLPPAPSTTEETSTSSEGEASRLHREGQ